MDRHVVDALLGLLFDDFEHDRGVEVFDVLYQMRANMASKSCTVLMGTGEWRRMASRDNTNGTKGTGNITTICCDRAAQ